MNYWTELSVEMANQRNYLDLLFRVYPIIPEDCRDIDKHTWKYVEDSFNKEDKRNLLLTLFKLKLFPLKDSYVAYLKKDVSAIDRNPETVNRIFGRLKEMGLDKIWERCSEPKEANRQMGQRFRQWVSSGVLGLKPIKLSEFVKSKGNAILDAGDAEMKEFAKQKLGYTRDKGLDFLGKFNGKYVIGEAKFLTDFGGHQDRQMEDALSLLDCKCKCAKVAILDGVCYIQNNSKMHKRLDSEKNIMSALVLREFLYSI